MSTHLPSRRNSKLPLPGQLVNLNSLLQRMKLDSKEHPVGRHSRICKLQAKAIIVAAVATVVLLACLPVNYPSSDPSNEDHAAIREQCDLFTGEWVPNLDAPYYTNSCYAIHEHQNCRKFGRPDTEFLKWRWKPDGCELPIFDADMFVEIMRNKSIAYVGDSVGRNHVQSLICLMSKIEYPEYSDGEKFTRWVYKNSNFSMTAFWTPFLVKWDEADPNGPSKTGIFNLYLDQFDFWVDRIDEFDYVIINGGRWFYRSSIFHENGKISGCRYCLLQNVTDLPMLYGYRKAVRTALRGINSRPNFKGVAFLRTLAPSHFENGEWNEGGNCVRTRPWKRHEANLSDIERDQYEIQLEEFKAAKMEGDKTGKKFMLFDITRAFLLRPDGHPSRYGHWPDAKVTLYNDCVHWCLPGPIDVWSDLFLEMLQKEPWRSDQTAH